MVVSHGHFNYSVLEVKLLIHFVDEICYLDLVVLVKVYFPVLVVKLTVDYIGENHLTVSAGSCTDVPVR